MRFISVFSFLLLHLIGPSHSSPRRCERDCGNICNRVQCPSAYKCHVDYCNNCIATCVPDTTCKRFTNCPASFEPVCATNGRTYYSSCHLDIERCTSPHLQVRYKGSCIKYGEFAIVTPRKRLCGQGRPVCPRVYRPVCGTDDVVYQNKCFLKYERRCKDRSVWLRHKGVCAGHEY